MPSLPSTNICSHLCIDEQDELRVCPLVKFPSSSKDIFFPSFSSPMEFICFPAHRCLRSDPSRQYCILYRGSGIPVGIGHSVVTREAPPLARSLGRRYSRFPRKERRKAPAFSGSPRSLRLLARPEGGRSKDRRFLNAISLLVRTSVYFCHANAILEELSFYVSVAVACRKRLYQSRLT